MTSRHRRTPRPFRRAQQSRALGWASADLLIGGGTGAAEESGARDQPGRKRAASPPPRSPRGGVRRDLHPEAYRGLGLRAGLLHAVDAHRRAGDGGLRAPGRSRVLSLTVPGGPGALAPPAYGPVPWPPRAAGGKKGVVTRGVRTGRGTTKPRPSRRTLAGKPCGTTAVCARVAVRSRGRGERMAGGGQPQGACGRITWADARSVRRARSGRGSGGGLVRPTMRVTAQLRRHRPKAPPSMRMSKPMAIRTAGSRT